MTFKIKTRNTALCNTHSGQGANLTDLECWSATAVGDDIPTGVVVLRLKDDTANFYPTKHDRVTLPFKVEGGKKQDGNALVVDDIATNKDGDLLVAGVSVWTSHVTQYVPIKTTSPALVDADFVYYRGNCDTVTIARTGDINVYTETDLPIGATVGYRSEITDPADALQALGAIGNVDDATKGADFTEFAATVKEAASAGGIAVITLHLI